MNTAAVISHVFGVDSLSVWFSGRRTARPVIDSVNDRRN